MGLKAGWLALFLFVWIIGAIFGSTFEFHVDTATGSAEQIAAAGDQAGKWGFSGNGTSGYAQSPQTTLEYIFDIKNSFQKLPFVDVSVPIPSNPKYWDAVYRVVTWRWSFMEDAPMVYWIFFFPFVAMGIFSLIMIAYGIITGSLSWS
jgi:hypothetical protein